MLLAVRLVTVSIAVLWEEPLFLVLEGDFEVFGGDFLGEGGRGFLLGVEGRGVSLKTEVEGERGVSIATEDC